MVLPIIFLLLSVPAFAQTAQLTHGTQEVIVTVYDPTPTTGLDLGYSAGVDFILWGLAPDTYGPPLPVLLPTCTESNKCNISVMWDTTQGPNGIRTVYARAWDKRGNKSLEVSKTYNVQNDTTPPVITISSPQAGATVSGQVNISARATDDISGIASMEVWVNGRQRAFVLNRDFIDARWNSNPERRNFPLSIIQVRAKDRLGNETFKTIQVQVR